MPFSMVVSPIGQWFARFFSFNTLIIAAITIGVLCILTWFHTGLTAFLAGTKPTRQFMKRLVGLSV